MSRPHCRNCGSDNVGPYYCEDCQFDGISVSAADNSEENGCAHSWVYTGTEYGGDDESYHGEGRCYCEFCGADGDA